MHFEVQGQWWSYYRMHTPQSEQWNIPLPTLKLQFRQSFFRFDYSSESVKSYSKTTPGLLVATNKYDRHIPPQISTVTNRKQIFVELLKTNLIMRKLTVQKIMNTGRKHQSKLMKKYSQDLVSQQKNLLHREPTFCHTFSCNLQVRKLMGMFLRWTAFIRLVTTGRVSYDRLYNENAKAKRINKYSCKIKFWPKLPSIKVILSSICP